MDFALLIRGVCAPFLPLDSILFTSLLWICLMFVYEMMLVFPPAKWRCVFIAAGDKYQNRIVILVLSRVPCVRALGDG